MTACITRDHPRMGGEKFATFITGYPYTGSPPRGRGKGSKADVECLRSRITPAWAGKSATISTHCLIGGDHPRVGGEKPEWAPITFLMLGSPPHGRGKDGRGMP